MHIIFGIHSIQAALDTTPESIITLHICNKKSSDRLLVALQKQAKANDISIQITSNQSLDKISNKARHQGIVAQTKKINTGDEKSLIRHLSNIKNPLVLVLDNVVDPRNFGACIRSAAACGVDALVFPSHSASPLTPLVHHTSAGTSFYLPLFEVSNLARSLDLLKKINIWCYGLSADSKQTLYQTDLTGGVAIVMGAEGSGLKQRTQSLCDFMINIPMHNKVESLNVSVASAVSLFEANRQRNL